MQMVKDSWIEHINEGINNKRPEANQEAAEGL